MARFERWRAAGSTRMNRKGANAPRDAGDDVLSEMLLIGLALALCWTVGAGIEAGLRFVGIELIRGDQ